MSCAVDVVTWGERNRVRLFTGKRQRWTLARTSRDKPTQTSLVATTKAVLVKWFLGTPLDTQFADAGDAVDDVTVLAVSETPPPAPAGAQRREDLDPVPLVAAGLTPPLFVTIELNYRGYAQDLPWPVWTASASPFRSDKLCPFDCDWMLVWAAPVESLIDAPEEAGLLEKLSVHGGGILPGVAQAVQLAGWALVAYLGFQAFQVLSLPSRLGTARRSRA